MFDIAEINQALGLHPVHTRVAWTAPPPLPRRITFLDRQEELQSGVVYLSTMEDAETVFAERAVTAFPGAMLLVSEWRAPTVAFPDGLTVVGYADRIGPLYNLLNDYLRRTVGEEPSRQFSRFWNAISARDSLTTEEIRAMLQRLPDAQAPFAQVCAVEFDSTPTERIPYTLVMRELLSVLPHSFGTVRNNEIIIMITYQERRFNYPYDLERLAGILEHYNAYIGFGNGTRDLTALPMLYTLIRHTIRLALKIQVGMETRIMTFERLGMYLAIDLAARGFKSFMGADGLMYLAHPAITYLTRYDEEKNNNLRMTLYFYLLTDKSIAETAKRLHMHRNTVMYKVKQMQELCGLDLEDPHLCERLLFSCQLARYYEQMNANKSPQILETN